MENLVQIALQNVNMAAILPSLVLTCFGMGLLLINVFLPRGTTRHAVWISVVSHEDFSGLKLICLMYVLDSADGPGNDLVSDATSFHQDLAFLFERELIEGVDVLELGRAPSWLHVQQQQVVRHRHVVPPQVEEEQSLGPVVDD